MKMAHVSDWCEIKWEGEWWEIKRMCELVMVDQEGV